MKDENLNNNNMHNSNICSKIELLIDDYLDGMIAAEDKNRMDAHIAECAHCSHYLEETVRLLEKIKTIPNDSNFISSEKKNMIWNAIETGIAKESRGEDKKGSYNRDNVLKMNPGKPVRKSSFKSFRYMMSGIAAVLILGFLVFAVNKFTKINSPDGNNVTSNIEVGTYWKVANIKGSPVIDNVVMKSADSIKMGQWITTDDSSKAELTVAGIGTVTIEPKSRIRVVKSEDNEHRISLEYGTIAAEMSSAPRTFFVDTKSVTAVDLGCAYTFSVDTSGDGILYVKTGKVSLESPNRESVVPAGKVCLTKKDLGPGTPFREDSSPKLKKALMDFDFGQCGGTCVNVILNNAKKTDAVTLLNILPRVDNDYKERVYSKVANFVPPPRHLPADSIPFINMDHLDEWIEKIQDQVQAKIEANMDKIEENMDKLSNLQIPIDPEKWGKEWERNWSKNLDKNGSYNWRRHRGGEEADTIIDREQMQRTMENVKEELQRAKEEMKMTNEEFQQEMRRAQEEIQRAQEEMKREQERESEQNIEQKQRDKELKEQEKERKNEMKEREKEMKEHQKEMKELEKEKNNNDGDK